MIFTCKKIHRPGQARPGRPMKVTGRQAGQAEEN